MLSLHSQRNKWLFCAAALLAVGGGAWLISDREESAVDVAPPEGGEVESPSESPAEPGERSELETGAPAPSEAASARSTASTTPAARGRIVGRVFDAHGAPLPAASVLAASPGADLFTASFATASDRDGWYELRDVAVGRYELGVRPAGVPLGSTVLEVVEVRPGETAVADLALRGARTVRGSFEFASEWEEMDMSLVRIVLWRKGEWGSAVARGFAFTSHSEPWRSGGFRFEGLEPGVYSLEAWPYVEEAEVWRCEVDVTLSDVALPCRALGSDGVWRERPCVEAPRTAWERDSDGG